MRINNFNMQNYINQTYKNFSQIISDIKKSRENPYEIAGWLKKKNKENDILIYRITATDKYIESSTIFDIYRDNKILFNFSKEEIKYICSLAILLLYKHEPKYKIIWENFRNNLQLGIINIEESNKSHFIKLNITQIEKNITLIDEIASRDAYNLGKEMGIRERILEEKIIAKK